MNTKLNSLYIFNSIKEWHDYFCEGTQVTVMGMEDTRQFSNFDIMEILYTYIYSLAVCSRNLKWYKAHRHVCMWGSCMYIDEGTLYYVYLRTISCKRKKNKFVTHTDRTRVILGGRLRLLRKIFGHLRIWIHKDPVGPCKSK